MTDDARDAARYRALRTILDAALVASVYVNEHRINYQDAPDPDDDTFGFNYVIQWYPNTPIGFSTLGADTLDALADRVADLLPAMLAQIRPRDAA